MLTVRKTSILKPFAEAVAFQRRRVPMTREQFDLLSNEAKMRAWTIAGIAKRSTLEESYRLAMRATEEGLTKEQFHKALSELIEKNGGMLLDRNRTGLIFQNNHNIATASGRYEQMRQVEGREYFQYPLIPNDSRLSDICRRLLGLVAHRDWAGWKSIWPPNHHRDRHKSPRSLTKEQAEATGKLYDAGNSEEDRYPFIDGQRVLPDPGFDFEPGLLSQDSKALAEAASAIGAPATAKTAGFYGLADLGKVKGLPKAPPLSEGTWGEFQSSLGIQPAKAGSIVQDALGDGVTVNRQTFEAMADAKYSSWIASTLEDPAEVWMVPAMRGDDLVFSTRYIGVYRDGRKKRFIALERSPEGWLMKAEIDPDTAEIRKGLLVSSKAGGSK